MENLTLPQLVLIIAVSLVVFFALQRWFLAIDAQIKNQRKIIDLLTKIAGKEGIEEAELQELKSIKK